MPPPKNTKKDALDRALLASTAGNSQAVHAALDAYVRAPRGNLDLNGRRGHLRTELELLAATGYPQLQRWFHRVPKKRNLLRKGGPLTTWTSGMYKAIQAIRRNPGATSDLDPREVAWAARDSAWLQTYMTRHALRAPALPQGAPQGPLYRGVRVTERELLDLANERTWSDRGFMSFTREKHYAVQFGDRQTGRKTAHLVLFRLRLADVARGTPWIWFVDFWQARRLFAAHYTLADWGRRGWAAHGDPEEAEVTLPPGTLHVRSIAASVKGTNATIGATDGREYDFTGLAPIVVDVAFTPAPEFAWKPRRKGTRESNDNILWNIFANEPVTRKRARQPSPSPQPSRMPRA